MLLQDNDRFSAYGDYVEMTDERFWLMGEILATLCLNSQSYCLYLNSDEIFQFVNTAVRLYNKFYGKGHIEYIGKVNREAWTTHQTFSEYLLYLDWRLGCQNDNEQRNYYRLTVKFKNTSIATGRLYVLSDTCPYTAKIFLHKFIFYPEHI